MILSHKHKFIYIKNKKVAGTSVEIALSKFCGSDDILTKLTPKKDENKRKKLGYRTAQNHNVGTYYNHMPCKSIRKMVGDDIFNSYYKFCHVRNPWDRMVSKYFFRKKKYDQRGWTFKDFIKHKVERVDIGITRQKSYKRITESDQLMIDDFYYFEDLKQSLVDIGNKLSLPSELILPETKRDTRGKDKTHYSLYYDDESIESVRKTFQFEIETFGYEFDDRR